MGFIQTKTPALAIVRWVEESPGSRVVHKPSRVGHARGEEQTLSKERRRGKTFSTVVMEN